MFLKLNLFSANYAHFSKKCRNYASPPNYFKFGKNASVTMQQTWWLANTFILFTSRNFKSA